MTTVTDLRCPSCHEPAVRLPRPLPSTGWALAVEPKRLEHAHEDGEPLCPVMTPTGYQPGLPEPAPGVETAPTGALTTCAGCGACDETCARGLILVNNGRRAWREDGAACAECQADYPNLWRPYPEVR